MATKKKALIGMIAGGVLTLTGPAAGMALTALSMHGAFDSVNGTAVPPEDKARHLAAGVSTAMNMTAIGIAVAVLGIIILIVSAIVYARSRSEDQPS